jgi:hypothetical protein
MKKIILIVTLLLFQSIYSQTNFEIIPPKGWTNFTKSDIVKSLNQKYTIPESKKEEIIRNKTSIEIARFMTNSKNGTYSPNIQVILRPNGTKNISEFKSAIEKSTESLKTVLGDFKVTKPLTQITVNGKDALIFKNEGFLKTITGEKNYFRTTLLLIPNGDTFYQITLNDTKTDSYEKEFNASIESIKF